MLPQLGFQELLLLAVLALVIIGPKDLPLLARKLGRWMAHMRGLAQEFRSGFDELARQAELDELKREVDALRRDRTLTDLDYEIRRQMAPLPPPPPPPALEAPRAEEKTEAPPEGDEPPPPAANEDGAPRAKAAGGA